MDSSTKLINSTMDGSLHPFCTPTPELRQVVRETLHVLAGADGDRSQTKPVLLSRTTALLKPGRITNRSTLGRALSQFCVTLACTSSLTGGAAAAGIPRALNLPDTSLKTFRRRHPN